MAVAAVRDRTLAISRYANPAIPPGGLTTTAVAVDVRTPGGATVTGFGFTSIGRFGAGGLMHDRFVPRLLAADDAALFDPDGAVDPVAAWTVMMAGEKPGGHGERGVAVGALEMALWDAAAKQRGLPLYEVLRRRFAPDLAPAPVAVYASGGYRYPGDDRSRLRDEIARMRDLGHERVKIKIGAADVDDDLRRLEVVADQLPAERVAVDAMNAYDGAGARRVAALLAPYRVWWFEDICDPHDFATHRAVARTYGPPLAAGEALFSWQEAVLLADHGGLRPERDILLFDPAHCYGVTGFARIVAAMTERGWPRDAFWPHGGHLFTLHVAAAFGLGGTEVNPFAFAPFGGLGDATVLANGRAPLPSAPGIGFETRAAMRPLLADLGVR